MTTRYTARKDSTPDGASRSGVPPSPPLAPLPLRSGVRLAAVALEGRRLAPVESRRQKLQRLHGHFRQFRRPQELWHGTADVQAAAAVVLDEATVRREPATLTWTMPKMNKIIYQQGNSCMRGTRV